ncbi:MAG: hydroxymethylbilane synthase [Deltaproteobacteria bacterium]|nr:hydroxymethylbilane synthase [Deltaproteobacteria bacterium]
MSRIRLGTRGSTLALAQANWVKAQIEARGDNVVELSIIKTSGDRFVDTAIQNIGSKGVFTKEIEDALLNNEIDLAVHSMKDLPTELPDGLAIIAVPEREDARDVLVTSKGARLAELASGAKLGTSSLRRRAQLLHYRPDISVVNLRGNVDTRLKKLDAGAVDGLVMAAAGLKRIGRQARITEYLDASVCVSAVAQGALGIEARADSPLRQVLSFLNHAATHTCVRAERAFLRRLSGGCHLPVGGHAVITDRQLILLGIVAQPDGQLLHRGELSGPIDGAEKLGEQLGEKLLAEGAAKILAAV